MIISPAETFAAEIDAGNFVSAPQPLDITFPQIRRRNSVADNVCRQKIIVVAAEETFKTGTLAAGAAEEDFPAAVEFSFNALVDAANLALHVLGAAKIFEFVEIFRRRVVNVPVFVEVGAEDDTALVQNLLGERSEDAAA